MKKDKVTIAGYYLARVSGRAACVQITGLSASGGWDAVDTPTGRSLRIPSARSLRERLDRAPIPKGARVAISVDDGLNRGVGIVRDHYIEDGRPSYLVDVVSGDPCDDQRTADGELWVCDFEVKPLPRRGRGRAAKRTGSR